LLSTFPLSSGQAGVDAEADAGGIATIRLIDPPPRPGALHDAGLEVVDPEHRRDPSDAAERLVLGVVHEPR
jgi:hypothetical protein